MAPVFGGRPTCGVKVEEPGAVITHQAHRERLPALAATVANANHSDWGVLAFEVGDPVAQQLSAAVAGFHV
jgi:hypothetical protein